MGGVNPFMMTYTLYELERGIEPRRLHKGDAGTGRFGSALSELGGMARRIVGRASRVPTPGVGAGDAGPAA
jgi:hypothetical protein